MTPAERKQKREAAAEMLVQASRFEHQANAAILGTPEQVRMMGRALQSRGSAWVLQAEVMEAER